MECSETIQSVPSRCYRCHRLTPQHQVCSKCRKASDMQHVWVVGLYADLIKKIIYALKFERSSYLSKDIAKFMVNALPLIDSDIVISFVPTAPKRIRIRGYDQAKLISKELANLLNLNHVSSLIRVDNSRQLGSDRKTRYQQAKQSLQIKKYADIKDKKVLLVDDVLTSGATLETAAKIIKSNGAKSVDAIVFAQVID